ncbi:MAG TPA: ATP-binding protein, partial [Kofleriaceae bacterium]
DALATESIREHVVELHFGATWIRLTASLLEDERLVAIVEDITARYHAEQQLERHRNLLAESQRMASIGSFRFDHVTGEIIWSDEMYRLHGVTPQSFSPSLDGILALATPETSGPLGIASRPKRGTAGNGSVIYSVTLPDGARRVLRGHAESQVDKNGDVLVSVGTVQDITEHERAVSESRASAARERLASDANRAKTEFLAHMSHELRTPLNAVLGLSEALLERIFGELNDAQSSTLATIYSSGRHLLELINDVLDIARVEAGKLPIDAEQTALRPLLDESTALVAAQLAAKAQRLVIELSPALPPVEIDRRRIKQVLINLLGNAVKFSPRGATVTLRASPTETGIEIAVSDTGPGIAAENLTRIFEPFVTLDPSLSRAHDGAGLGLALAKRIVELHGGNLRVTSELGNGATFTLELPIASAYVATDTTDALRVRRPSPPTPFASAKTTLLLAEDNAATVLAVRSFLETKGYIVRVASDGPTALAEGLSADIAAVLMDVQLPGMDGLEVTRRIRAAGGIEKPIIALTAHAMPGDEQRCLAAGATAYMAKPVQLRQLAAVLERLVGVEPS